MCHVTYTYVSCDIYICVIFCCSYFIALYAIQPYAIVDSYHEIDAVSTICDDDVIEYNKRERNMYIYIYVYVCIHMHIYTFPYIPLRYRSAAEGHTERASEGEIDAIGQRSHNEPHTVAQVLTAVSELVFDL